MAYRPSHKHLLTAPRAVISPSESLSPSAGQSPREPLANAVSRHSFLPIPASLSIKETTKVPSESVGVVANNHQNRSAVALHPLAAITTSRDRSRRSHSVGLTRSSSSRTANVS